MHSFITGRDTAPLSFSKPVSTQSFWKSFKSFLDFYPVTSEGIQVEGQIIWKSFRLDSLKMYFQLENMWHPPSAMFLSRFFARVEADFARVSLSFFPIFIRRIWFAFSCIWSNSARVR